MEWLRALYVAATIFGVGVTAADLIGAFSSMGSGEGTGDGDDGDGGGDGDTGIEFDGVAGELDVDIDVGSDIDVGDGDTDGADGDDGDDGDTDSDGEGSIIAHDRRHRRNPVLLMLTALRTLVYFSLGFGPVGWFATTQYPAIATTLLWSLPMGVAVATGTRMLRAFMRKDLSSTITKEDLIMEKGVVTVSIAAGQAGKVRISIGGVYVDRFARSAKNESLGVGAPVRVVDSDDEYVYVESELE